MKQTDKKSHTKSNNINWRNIFMSVVRYWWVAAIAIALVAVTILYKNIADNPPITLKVERNTHIDVTPEQIQAVRDIGQWEFLSVNTEEMVEWHQRRTLGADHLVRIYQGTLRMGINMEHATNDWFTSLPDSTARLKLPPIELLDNNFIDEARTRSFYEHGTIPADVLDKLYAEAQQKMRKRCLTPQNMQTAERNARQQFERIFKQMGFKRVEISFLKG